MSDILLQYSWNNHKELNKQRLTEEFIKLSLSNKLTVYRSLSKNRKHLLRKGYDEEKERNKKQLRLEELQDEELYKLWSKIKRKYQKNTHIDDIIEFDMISIIILRTGSFEEIFRNEIGTFYKNDLHYIFLRGVYDMYANFYKRNFADVTRLNNKDDVSRTYKSAKNTISKLLDEHYTPLEKKAYGISELDLSTEEIEKFMRVLDGIIYDMELSPNDDDIFAKDSAHTALSWVGLPKSTRDNILIIFRKLQKEDPLFAERTFK